ncbi:hypothetical protein PIB30_105901, partial [Stylosanthes scabra]|nr:hypothetical protein [Stylosanthes scabra]
QPPSPTSINPAPFVAASVACNRWLPSSLSSLCNPRFPSSVSLLPGQCQTQTLAAQLVFTTVRLPRRHPNLHRLFSATVESCLVFIASFVTGAWRSLALSVPCLPSFSRPLLAVLGGLRVAALFLAICAEILVGAVSSGCLLVCQSFYHGNPNDNKDIGGGVQSYENSQVATARFQVAAAIREAAIREWGFLSVDDKKSLIRFA